MITALSVAALLLGAEAVSANSGPITLVSRKVPHEKRALRRAQAAAKNLKSIKQTSIPLADQYNGTDLEWFGNISVGTPPQTIPVVFDTGSETLEFTSTQCKSSCKNQILFDVSKSSTYVDGGDQQTITFATGGGVTPVIGDNTRLTLLSGTDTVSVGGLTATDTALYTITSQTAVFDTDPYSGIQGMSTQAEGFFAGLIDQGLPSIFSLYLTPEKEGAAELTIGGIDETKFNGDLTYAAVPSDNEGSWELPSSQIFVNGKTASSLKKSRTIIFDSGTTNVLFPTSTTEEIYSLISSDIKAYDAEPGTYGIACSKVSSLAAVISLTFTSTDNKKFNLTIPSEELSVGPFANDPDTCQTLINAYDGLNLVGGSLLKHYYSVWDIGNQQIGFAPNGF